MHDIQKQLLSRLKYSNGLRYSELVGDLNFNDNIVFHIHFLEGKKYIQKINKKYCITILGLQKINEFDTKTLEDRGTKSFFIGFFCEYESKYMVKEHTIKDKKFYNFPSGRPWFGENLQNSLIRTFYEETSVELHSTQFCFKSLHMKTVKSSAEEVIFDDAFAIYNVELNADNYSNVKFLKGCQWMTKQQIQTLPNKWKEVDMCIFENQWFPYYEYEFVSDYILLS